MAAKANQGRHRSPDRAEDHVRGALQVGQSLTSAAPRTGRKTSTARATATGAVKGAGAGATVGSLIPGVGTAAGAGVGAVVGGAHGAHSARAARRAARAGGTRALIAEFLVAMVILGLSPLADPEGTSSPRDWVKRASATCGLFLVLGLVASVGPRTARAAAGFGGLVVLVLAIDQRSIFGVLAQHFGTTGTGPPAESGPPAAPPPPPADDEGEGHTI